MSSLDIVLYKCSDTRTAIFLLHSVSYSILPANKSSVPMHFIECQQCTEHFLPLLNDGGEAAEKNKSGRLFAGTIQLQTI